MELNGYRLLLPEGTLDYFDLVDVKESVNEVVIYLEEKKISFLRSIQIRILRVKAFMILLLFRIFLSVARRSSLIFVVVAGS